MKEATGMDAGEKEIKDMSCFAPRPFWLSWADAYIIHDMVNGCLEPKDM